MKTIVWLCVAVAFTTALAPLFTSGLLWGDPCWTCAFRLGRHSHRRGSVERNSSATLKTIASAQADYRGNDRDENGTREFWRADISGLYGVVPKSSSEMIKLIEISAASADAAAAGNLWPGDVGPGQVAQEAYAVRSPKAGYYFRALRHADEDPKKLDPQRFAACAYPADYPKSGRMTHVVCEDNTIYARDLGRPGPPDVYPDPATRDRDWTKLD